MSVDDTRMRSRHGELAADTIDCLAQRFSVGPKYLAPPAPLSTVSSARGVIGGAGVRAAF